MKLAEVVVIQLDSFVRIPTNAIQFAVIVFANADDHHFFGIDLIDGNVADADNLLRVNQQNRTRRQQTAETTGTLRLSRRLLFLPFKTAGRLTHLISFRCR